MRVNRILLYTGIVVLGYLLSGCTSFYYYDIEPREVSMENGSLFVKASNISSAIAYANDTTDYLGTSFEEFRRKLMSNLSRYKGMSMDSLSTYLAIMVGHRNVEIGRAIRTEDGIPETILRADSIYVRFAPHYNPVPIIPIEQVTEEARHCIQCRLIYVEPIVIPISYKDDFIIEFVLSIYSMSDSTLIERKPVFLKGYRKKYTEIFGK